MDSEREQTGLRTALVTGGTGGLGTAVTARFLHEGWRVVVPWVAPGELPRLPRHKMLELTETNLFDDDAVASCVELAASREDAPLQAVVNLVGGFSMAGRVHETPIEDFESQLRLNLRPTYLACHHTLPHMLKTGGSIVCVSSRAVRRPFSRAAGYITAKAAVLALVDSLAVEYKLEGVRINAVLPSTIDTPGNRAANPDADYSRWVKPERIADVIHYLCTDSASAITGTHLDVPGRV
ncbi:SDR family oxidoreductase [Actinocrispum wychmicini]|uniref:NAD(P)-dependent dehydrogenase (Short-subunit alcohol dehydrogenase family) n=1 Tax=Actinocrispum wychmicini TaxID=1213861 RepID=A0A4R2IQJ4_9PSEU|nr:SDR family oxidoreductase [Actinocrispum wychmicini]TCO46696.1 NAD(P)-dependent dehydrogenase (short-subunit alcohol dehydrogenase family) [Actinocrispum wychmicini]